MTGKARHQIAAGFLFALSVTWFLAMTDDPKPPVIIKAVPDVNEREMIEFFYELGNSVNRWAYVDRQLYGLCRFGLQMDARQTAVLYYRQSAFNNRLRLVSDALKSLLSNEQFVAEWKPIFDRIEGLAETRNIFVHHPAKRLGTSDGTKPVYIYTIHIEPTARLLNRDYPGLRGKGELGIEDLRQHTLDVEALERDLVMFHRKLKRAQKDVQSLK